MKIKSILATVAVLVISTSVYATPQYNGSTVGTKNNFDTERTHLTDDTSGYYIWNNAGDPSKWALRWTGNNADTSNSSIIGNSGIDWFGSITFASNGLGTVTEKSFDSGDISSVIPASTPFNDTFTWSAVTGTNGGWDGINFTLASYETLLSFSLGSDLYAFADLPLHSGAGVASKGIYIGGGTSGSPAFNTTNVLVKDYDAGRRVQSFEISVVPEPSIIALFGLGLVGLGFAGRRRQQS
jgi:hypothetical protein